MITILSKIIQFCFWLVLLKKNRLHIQRMLELAILAVILVQPFLDCVPTVVEADPGTIYVPDDHTTIQYASGTCFIDIILPRVDPSQTLTSSSRGQT